MTPPSEGSFDQNPGAKTQLMRVLLTVLLSFTALVAVLVTGLKGSESYTTHIGSRTPPADAECFQSGELETDAGKVLKVFRCPV